MNKKGISGGMVLLIVGLLVVAYVTNFAGLADIFKPTEAPPVTGKCPSSGLTEITINTQEALASTATDADADYFIYDNGVLVANGNSGSDGKSTVDVGCAVGKKYSGIILNTSKYSGYYPQMITIDASGPTDIHNLKMYEYGDVNFVNLGSATDPAEDENIAGSSGKLCGVIASITENESVAAFNKPTLVCQVNSTAVEDLTFSGTTPGTKPSRLGNLHIAQLVTTYYTFVIDDMIKSTDAAIKLSGKIKFKTTNVDTEDRVTCVIVDQATYKSPDYKTLSISEGFIEGAEDSDASDVGAPDSRYQLLSFNDSAYC